MCSWLCLVHEVGQSEIFSILLLDIIELLIFIVRYVYNEGTCLLREYLTPWHTKSAKVKVYRSKPFLQER